MVVKGSALRFSFLLPAVLASMLVGIVLLVSPCSGGITIPPPPYVPKSPAEDIIIVEAYIELGTPNMLRLTVTFATATPPAGQEIWIIVTRLQGSTEVVLGMYGYGAAAKSTHSLGMSLIDGGNVDIALYAMLGTPATDRWPNTGFQRITSLSAGAPNRFTDYDNVGGVVLPTNNLTMLAPYLAAIGLVATAVVAIKKRRN